MNKDFQDKVNRLEELAGKATQEDWNCVYKFDERENYVGPEEWSDLGLSVCICRHGKDASYIAAARPSMIQEMLAEMRRLEKEVHWLAMQCQNVRRLPTMNGKPEDDRTAYNWREAARRAVEEKEHAAG